MSVLCGRRSRSRSSRLPNAGSWRASPAEPTRPCQAAHRAAADFHQTVISLAGNELLSELEGVLRSRLRWLLGRHDDLLGIAEEHEALYQAIAQRDVSRVESLVLHHLATSRAAVQGHFRQDST
ncbi:MULTISPECIES: FCD domain-containing protein [unclassified Streptomyces]|uniref:FCD domain-containing protein n=1 Tax=unclassified Streptomyces TaxID=2593676 RepID=UPI0009A1276C|nr:FCD domain-containing protein [Streptomyces sp. TSRI0107]